MRDRDGITHWYFHLDGARSSSGALARSSTATSVDRATLRRAAETRESASKELGKTAFALRAVRPWIVDGKTIGYVELGEEIDHFLREMKARTGDDYGLLVEKRFLDEQAWASVLGPRQNTWNDRPRWWWSTRRRSPMASSTSTATWRRSRARGSSWYVERGDARSCAASAAERREGAEGRRALRPTRLQRQHAALRRAVRRSGDAVFAHHRRCRGDVRAVPLVFRRLALLRRRVEARAAEALPQGRVVRLRSEDELGRLEALFDRIVFRSRGDAPQAGDGAPRSDGAERKSAVD